MKPENFPSFRVIKADVGVADNGDIATIENKTGSLSILGLEGSDPIHPHWLTGTIHLESGPKFSIYITKVKVKGQRGPAIKSKDTLGDVAFEDIQGEFATSFYRYICLQTGTFEIKSPEGPYLSGWMEVLGDGDDLLEKTGKEAAGAAQPITLYFHKDHDRNGGEDALWDDCHTDGFSTPIVIDWDDREIIPTRLVSQQRRREKLALKPRTSRYPKRSATAKTEVICLSSSSEDSGSMHRRPVQGDTVEALIGAKRLIPQSGTALKRTCPVPDELKKNTANIINICDDTTPPVHYPPVHAPVPVNNLSRVLPGTPVSSGFSTDNNQRYLGPVPSIARSSATPIASPVMPYQSTWSNSQVPNHQVHGPPRQPFLQSQRFSPSAQGLHGTAMNPALLEYDIEQTQGNMRTSYNTHLSNIKFAKEKRVLPSPGISSRKSTYDGGHFISGRGLFAQKWVDIAVPMSFGKALRLATQKEMGEYADDWSKNLGRVQPGGKIYKHDGKSKYMSVPKLLQDLCGVNPYARGEYCHGKQYNYQGQGELMVPGRLAVINDNEKDESKRRGKPVMLLVLDMSNSPDGKDDTFLISGVAMPESGNPHAQSWAEPFPFVNCKASTCDSGFLIESNVFFNKLPHMTSPDDGQFFDVEGNHGVYVAKWVAAFSRPFNSYDELQHRMDTTSHAICTTEWKFDHTNWLSNGKRVQNCQIDADNIDGHLISTYTVVAVFKEFGRDVWKCMVAVMKELYDS